MPFQKILLALFSALLFFTYTKSAQAQDEKYVSIRLLPEKTQVQGGETVTIGIEQSIKKGWHTYWVNPGDSGTAARVAWTGIDGEIKADPISWPAPKRLPMGPLTNFGYEKNVILLQDITFPKDLADGSQTITATVDILVCEEICIPETHTASFIINGDEEAVPAGIEMARGKLPLPVSWKTSMREEGQNLIVDIATSSADAFSKLETVQLYPKEWGLISNPAKTVAMKSDTGLTLVHPRGDRALSDVRSSDMVITYEDKSGTRKAVQVSADGPALNITSTVAPNSNVGFIQAIFLAIIGGLILNLMPCVFPVLSMKALSLVQLKDKEASKARHHGLAYTAGIILSFIAIAAILIALKTGGAQIGWGFQLQNPAIILFLAYLFFTLGLNLAGFFEIDFGLANAGQSLTRAHGLSGSFFTGMLATLVATPCTAPFMGVAMGYALTQPAVISISVFVALGFGLALPYLALCYVPALRHILPRPGHWMETFRQFLSFPMFAATCWLIWVLTQQTDHMGVLIGLLGLLAIGFGIWLWKNRPHGKTAKAFVITISLAMFIFAAATLVIERHVEHSVSSQSTTGLSEPFSQEKLDAYLNDGQPVFVNMTAAWCITCKLNEKVALSIPSTENLFTDKKIKYLKGDWTNQNPEITKFLESYGRSGVPLYVYYAPQDRKGVVLPQILTPGIVEKTITQ
jgi:thiol:disulfide interchange protein